MARKDKGGKNTKKAASRSLKEKGDVRGDTPKSVTPI